MFLPDGFFSLCRALLKTLSHISLGPENYRDLWISPVAWFTPMSNWPWESEKDHFTICADLVEIPLGCQAADIHSQSQHHVWWQTWLRNQAATKLPQWALRNEHWDKADLPICSPTIEHTKHHQREYLRQAVSVCSSATQSNSKSTLKVAAHARPLHMATWLGARLHLCTPWSYQRISRATGEHVSLMYAEVTY